MISASGSKEGPAAVTSSSRGTPPCRHADRQQAQRNASHHDRRRQRCQPRLFHAVSRSEASIVAKFATLQPPWRRLTGITRRERQHQEHGRTPRRATPPASPGRPSRGRGASVASDPDKHHRCSQADREFAGIASSAATHRRDGCQQLQRPASSDSRTTTGVSSPVTTAVSASAGAPAYGPSRMLSCMKRSPARQAAAAASPATSFATRDTMPGGVSTTASIRLECPTAGDEGLQLADLGRRPHRSIRPRLITTMRSETPSALPVMRHMIRAEPLLQRVISWPDAAADGIGAEWLIQQQQPGSASARQPTAAAACSRVAPGIWRLVGQADDHRPATRLRWPRPVCPQPKRCCLLPSGSEQRRLKHDAEIAPAGGRCAMSPLPCRIRLGRGSSRRCRAAALSCRSRRD